MPISPCFLSLTLISYFWLRPNSHFLSFHGNFTLVSISTKMWLVVSNRNPNHDLIEVFISVTWQVWTQVVHSWGYGWSVSMASMFFSSCSTTLRQHWAYLYLRPEQKKERRVLLVVLISLSEKQEFPQKSSPCSQRILLNISWIRTGSHGYPWQLGSKEWEQLEGKW